MASDSFNLFKWSWFEAEKAEGHLVWGLWPLAGIISLSEHLSLFFITTKIWKHFTKCNPQPFCAQLGYQTLPKAKQTQGIEYLDSFNTFSAKQKFQRFEILVKLQLGFVWHKARIDLKFVATVMTGGRVKLFPTV